jgi:pimeloyl-ACP methyl ester carboxylesterase
MVATAAEGFLSPRLDARERRSTINVLGADTAVFTYEPETDRSAGPGTPVPTILAVHGFRGTHHGLLRVVDQLPDVRVIMPDLPGFGASGPLPGAVHNIDAYTEWLGSLSDELGLGAETVLLGHSFGSIVAAHFVAGHPGRFRQLILVNPISAPALSGPKGVLSQLAAGYYRAGAALPEWAGAGLLRHPLVVRIMSEAMAKTRDGALRRFVHGQHAAYFSDFANRDMLLESFEASISHTAAEVADRLTLPVLLVAGDRDEVAPLPAVRRFHERLEDSRLTVIPGVGHLIHYETPEPAAHAIRDFIREEATR